MYNENRYLTVYQSKGVHMIQLERTSVMNLENAIRGARNPMNSWGRMDRDVYKRQTSTSCW